jgi:hypothetical protein
VTGFAVPSVPLLIRTAGDGTDDLGNTTPGTDWDNPTETIVYGAVMPSTTNELRDAGARDQVVTTYRLYLAGRAAVVASARVVWEGLTLEVVGDPEFWPSPIGGIDHTECTAVVSAG